MASTSMFFTVWRYWFVDAADPLIAAVLWLVPAFITSMGFAALTIGVFYPAVRFVAGLVT
jgi:hypothetical protein